MVETVYCVLLIFMTFQGFFIGYVIGEGQRKGKEDDSRRDH